MASQARACPSCGSQAEPHQQVCIECGERLSHRALPGGWLLPVGGTLAIAALAAGVVLAFGRSDGPVTVVAPPLATTARTDSAPAATTAAASTAPATGASVVTAPRATAPSASPSPPPTTAVAPVTTAAPATTAPATSAAATVIPPTATTVPARTEPPATAGIATWPPGRDGFTVVLASLPTSRGLAQAEARARAALAAGLTQAGVLDSASFASLQPGYLVIFAGIYATLAEAQQGAARAQSAFPGAYPRRIAR